MNFPLYFFLFIYIAFMVGFVIFMLINLFHLSNSASLTIPSFIFTFFIFATTIIVLYFTALLLNNTDWKTQVFHANIPGEFSNTPF